MYTQCPHCQALFRMRAADLRAARGRARCGRCGLPFDALARLRDEMPGPPPSPETSGEQPPEPPRVDGPEPPGEQPPQPARQESATPRLGLEPVSAPSEAPGAQPRAASRPGQDAVCGAPAGAAPWTAQRGEGIGPGPRSSGRAGMRRGSGSARDPQAERGLVPEALRDDLQRMLAERRRSRQRALYGGASALLVLALVVQYAWFMPADLAARYPLARGALESFCALAGCRLPERRDASRIRMVSRDVRVHPRYEGALLVSAILENTAPHPQPYPDMQFSLYNVNGQRIAARRFPPQEYLAAEHDIAADMPPNTPIQIVLELLAPEQAVVSFEFRFI